MESCEVCGDDLRRFCSQGHAAGAGMLFCETCGEMLPLAAGGPAMPAAPPPTMDYSSGSFADFIAGGDEDAPRPGISSTALALADAPTPAVPAEVVPGPIVEPGLVFEPVPVPEPEPPAPKPPPPAPNPAPPAPPAAKATVTGARPAPPAPEAGPPAAAPPEAAPPAAAPPEVAMPTLAPPAAAPQAANGGAAVTTTTPPDLRFTIPRDAHRTWRSSTKPRDEPGPDGGVHHDDGPPVAGEPGSLAEPRPGRSRRVRVIAIVLLVAVLGAGGTFGAVALHRHYAARLTAPLSPPIARAGPTPAASTGAPAQSTSPAPLSTPVQPAGQLGWATPLPVQPLRDNAAITAVSCPTHSACYAADTSGGVLSSAPPAGWHRAATDRAAGLVAISCATATRCVALDRAGHALGLRNGVWSSPGLVDTGTGTFTGLSCPTSTFCMASDSGGAAFAETPGGWQQFSLATSGGGLTDVSCANASFCAAVDDGGGAYTYNGTTWTGVSAIDVGHSFTAVSCATATFCVAVDNSGNAAIFNHGTWHVSPMPSTALTVSCPARDFCVATNGTGGALTYQDGEWSTVTVVDGTAAINTLSCASPTFCVATDHHGDVLYYRPT